MSAVVPDTRGVQSSLTRGQKLWNDLLEWRGSPQICLERAKLFTDSYKETDGQHPSIRKAIAFEKIATQIPIFIHSEQLLVGDFSARLNCAEWYPEQDLDWIGKALEIGDSSWLAGDLSQLQEIIEYWKGKCVHDAILSVLDEEDQKRLKECTEEGAYVHGFFVELQGGKGWYGIDYEKAIQKGLLGILAEVEQEKKATSCKDDESFRKIIFLRGLAIVLRAAIQYGKRYAGLARELAQTATGKRKKELLRIADICEWVPANPARNFYEALQTLCFVHILIHLETDIRGVTPGRIDQYLYPYYKRDIEEGNITQEEAIDLLECFRVKMSSGRILHPSHLGKATTGEAQFHNVAVGGQTADGKDATNELSYLILEAAFRTRSTQHTISVRWHPDLSRDFFLKAVELASLGLGYPAFFNDNATIPFLLKWGSSLEEARNYVLTGCVVHSIPGKTAAVWPLPFNVPKCLELALYDGVDPKTGKKIGPTTGKFTDFKTFDGFFEAFKKQTKHFLHQGTTYLKFQQAFRTEIQPQMFDSCFIDDCIKRGKTSLGDGAIYQNTFVFPIGVIDVADSLAAIKKCVFESGSIGKRELLDALVCDFEGKENMRRLLLSAPKYGNDDDYVDSISAELYAWLSKTVDEIDALHGQKFCATPHSVSIHNPIGQKVGALPSGRLAWTPLADGGVSPCQGVDAKGPTAVINSAGKIDQMPLKGDVFNLKFHPSALETKEDQEKLAALIETYFEYGGKHIQFNVVDRATLLEAQAHPELHRNLIVRVAGYSALFTELDRGIQDEIIQRTEHVL